MDIGTAFILAAGLIPCKICFTIGISSVYPSRRYEAPGRREPGRPVGDPLGSSVRWCLMSYGPFREAITRPTTYRKATSQSALHLSNSLNAALHAAFYDFLDCTTCNIHWQLSSWLSPGPPSCSSFLSSSSLGSPSSWLLLCVPFSESQLYSTNCNKSRSAPTCAPSLPARWLTNHSRSRLKPHHCLQAPQNP